MTDAIHCPTCGAPLPPDAPQGECPRCLLKAGFASQPAYSQAAEPVGAAPFTVTRTSSGHSHFVPPSVAELQQRIPQYEILELIGQGGMGAVYKARQRGLERLVAIKILPFEISQSAAFTERFTREARALAMLNHPHIVAVHDFGQAEGMCYFVMEYVAGVNLRQALQAGKMNPAEALAIVPQICEALQFAHDEGVVHRDIKPENILIDLRGRVKIADFGLAKLLGAQTPEHSLTGTQQVMGTLRYMAPEQMFGSKEVDHRADIFSLGVVFYELLTGELPIGRFAPPSKKSICDARLDDVVLRALEAEPAQRYQHVSEMKTGVEAVARTPAAKVQPTYSPAAAPSQAAVSQPTHASPPHPFLGTSYHLAVCFGLSLMLLWFLMHAGDPLWSSFEGGDAKLIDLARGWGLGTDVNSVFSTLLVVLLALSGATGFAWWKYREAGRQQLRQPGAALPRPERREATANQATDAEPRLSPAALWGALLAPMFLVTVLMLMGSMIVYRVEAGGTEPSPPTRILAIVLLIPGVIGLFSPFATTLLGVLGISQIRNAKGKYYGMPLAVFDALAFPLLILDGVLLVMVFLLLAFVFSDVLKIPYNTPQRNWGPMLLTAVFALPAVIALDVWLVRLSWRAATRGLPLGAPAPHEGVAVQPLLPRQAAAPSDVAHGPRLSQTALWGAIIAPGVLLPLLLMALIFTSRASAGHNGHGPSIAGSPTWIMMPVMCAGLPGMIVPFVTTLLGVLAIGQIRRSDGKLYGLPLALFDALCFPLLLLDIVLLWLGFMLALLVLLTVLQLPMHTNLSALGPLLLTGLLVLPMVVVLDIWLVRLAWRAATKGLREYAAGVPEHAHEKQPQKEPPPFRAQSGRGVSTALVVILAVLAVFAIPTVVAGGVLLAYWFIPVNVERVPNAPVQWESHDHGEHGHDHEQLTTPAPAMIKEPAAKH